MNFMQVKLSDYSINVKKRLIVSCIILISNQFHYIKKFIHKSAPKILKRKNRQNRLLIFNKSQ